MKQREKGTTGNVRIIGPAAPEGHGAGDDTYAGFATMREHLVKISKRVRAREVEVSNYIRKLDGRPEIGKGKRISKDDNHVKIFGQRARKLVKKAGLDPGRTKIKKDAIGDDNSRPAPSTTGSDQDIDSRTHDFVDDILDPPYPFDIFASLYENSGPLRRNVDAMAANIDGFGYRFEPVLDFTHPDVADHIRDLMFIEKIEESHVDLDSLDESKVDEYEPTKLEIKRRKKLWERTAMVEKHRLRAFFEALNPKFSFTALRIQTRENLELFGNAGWEILRERRDDVYSKIEQAYCVPFASIRLVRQDKHPTSVRVKVRKDATRWDEFTYQRFFRRYVRIVGATRTYYKELGDPRIVSAQSGRYYSSVDEMRKEEGEGARPANELLHMAIPSLLSPYGIPRWVGALLAVLGNRASEEVNYLYFDNKAIPPMVVLVSGGRLSEDSVSRIESFMTERLKGRENFHKILVLEALPATGEETQGGMEPSGKLRIELKPLTSEMLQDGLFQEYDAANEMKIGRAFRQPAALTGDQRDANRSSMDTIKGIVEEQVYQPQRDMFDADMDRLFLSNLGVRFWHFKTNAPVTRFPNDLVANACKALQAGAIDPNEARALMEDAFSKDFPHRSEEWAKTPPALMEQEIRADAAIGAATARSDAQDARADAGGSDDAQPAQQDSGGQQDSSDTQKSARKEVLARGRTSEDDDHDHAFTVMRHGERATITVGPGGSDGHVHPPEIIRYVPSGRVRETLEPAPGGDHTHEVNFRFPQSPKRKRLEGLTKAILAIRTAAREEVDGMGGDFFNPETWQGRS